MLMLVTGILYGILPYSSLSSTRSIARRALA